MPRKAQSVIAFASRNFDISGSIVGRQSASAGFLHAYLRHGGAERYACFASDPAEIGIFKQLVEQVAPAGTSGEGMLPHEMSRIGEIGTLYRPGPDVGQLAWLRRGLGQRAFSITGVNHTLSDAAAVQAIGNLLIAPVQPWDALICASAASKAVIERVLEEYGAYFASLSGASLRPRLKLPVIPLGVDGEAFAPGPQNRAAERARLGLAEDEVALLYVGRFSHLEKASPVAMYLAAEQAASSTGKKIRLIESGWFAAPGIERAFDQAAQTLMPSVGRLVLDGRLPENRTIWQAADIFVSLSDNIQESFGLTPIEAMASGLPVVVSDWDGYRDSVRDGLDGFRIPSLAPPPGEGEALAFLYAAGYGGHDAFCGAASQGNAVSPGRAASALVTLINDANLRRNMGESGRAHTLRHFDWKVVIATYQDLWAELAEIRATAPEAAPISAGRAARPLAMDPYAQFAGFPTDLLMPNTLITLTPGVDAPMAQGMKRIQAAAPLPSLLLSDEELQALIGHLEKGPAEAGQLLSLFETRRHNAVWLTLGWMAKTGLVSWV